MASAYGRCTQLSNVQAMDRNSDLITVCILLNATACTLAVVIIGATVIFRGRVRTDVQIVTCDCNCRCRLAPIPEGSAETGVEESYVELNDEECRV
jgi:hypothetical protein